MPRLRAYVYVLAFLSAVIVAVVSLRSPAAADVPPATTTTVEPPPPPTVQGLDAAGWHRVASRYLGRVRSLQSTLRTKPETATAIGLACVVYGHCAELWRKARCESNLHRYSVDTSSGAAGLFQFLPSTWRSTPFGRYSIFDPYANALAAGWMHSRGRGGEWVCR
jgi:hypothetical protein